MARQYLKKSQLQTVFFNSYSEDELFWLGHQCKKCGLRFETVKEMQTHALIHKTPRKGICPICKKTELLHSHHYNYKDFEIDKSKNTIDICPTCHGYQQSVMNLINQGISVIYIGHVL